jgi:hypothetical protein
LHVLETRNEDVAVRIAAEVSSLDLSRLTGLGALQLLQELQGRLRGLEVTA